VLEFRDVTISYGSSSNEDVAIYNLNMKVEAGTVFGIAGESGCGKSTIAKALLDLLPPYASVTGEMLFDNRNILATARRERDALRGREISMIFQDPATALNPIRKIRRQFYDILCNSEKSKAALDKRIEEELSAVHLPEPKRVMNQYPPQLSGGMKQRVVIAAAICNRPRLLIADEPTSALDASVRLRIIDEIARIKHEHNLTLLYISHNLAELERICDSIMVMKDGCVIEQGSTEQIIHNPKKQYTRSLIQAAFGGNIDD
jgi:ABC-type dipeptide/oligopeptide/nickel transport system ATPase component